MPPTSQLERKISLHFLLYPNYDSRLSAPKITGNPFFQLPSKGILGSAGNAWRFHKSDLLVLPPAALLCSSTAPKPCGPPPAAVLGSSSLSWPLAPSRLPSLAVPAAQTQVQVFSKPLRNAWGNIPGSRAVNALVAESSSPFKGTPHTHPPIDTHFLYIQPHSVCSGLSDQERAKTVGVSTIPKASQLCN